MNVRAQEKEDEKESDAYRPWPWIRKLDITAKLKSNGLRVNDDLGAPRGIPLPNFDDTQYDQAKVRIFLSLSAEQEGQRNETCISRLLHTRD